MPRRLTVTLVCDAVTHPQTFATVTNSDGEGRETTNLNGQTC